MLAEINWTVLGVGFLTAFATIAGTSIGVVIQGQQSSAAWRRERADRSREERRMAYMALLRNIDGARSKVDGQKAVRQAAGLKPEETAAFTEAVAAVEFLAPAATWERMRPLAETVSAMANFMAVTSRGGGVSAAVMQEAISLHGGDTLEGWERLRTEYLAAAREDLQRDA